jgi:DNA-damage-inducible protein D
VLKNRLNNEGSELVSFCYQLKMPAPDGKLRSTDVLNSKNILRLFKKIFLWKSKGKSGKVGKSQN